MLCERYPVECIKHRWTFKMKVLEKDRICQQTFGWTQSKCGKLSFCSALIGCSKQIRQESRMCPQVLDSSFYRDWLLNASKITLILLNGRGPLNYSLSPLSYTAIQRNWYECKLSSLPVGFETSRTVPQLFLHRKKKQNKRREFPPAQIQITVMYLFFSHILAGYKIFIRVKPRRNTVFFFLSPRFFPGLRSETGPSPAEQDRAALPTDNPGSHGIATLCWLWDDLRNQLSQPVQLWLWTVVWESILPSLVWTFFLVWNWPLDYYYYYYCTLPISLT